MNIKRKQTVLHVFLLLESMASALDEEEARPLPDLPDLRANRVFSEAMFGLRDAFWILKRKLEEEQGATESSLERPAKRARTRGFLEALVPVADEMPLSETEQRYELGEIAEHLLACYGDDSVRMEAAITLLTHMGKALWYTEENGLDHVKRANDVPCCTDEWDLCHTRRFWDGHTFSGAMHWPRIEHVNENGENVGYCDYCWNEHTPYAQVNETLAKALRLEIAKRRK